jgi:hypothetical protein
MVEGYLHAHPEGAFSPTAIGRDLSRSAGAVNNALERLVAEGRVVLMQAKPKRFALKAAAGSLAL